MGKSVELTDIVDRLVVNTKKMDWVTRHKALRPYARNPRYMELLKERLSPDEWLHGECTGKKVELGKSIRLWEYPHGRKNQTKDYKQRRMDEFFDRLPKN